MNMKKVLLAVALVLVALVITNPDLTAHKDALVARENAGLVGMGLNATLMRGQVSQVVARRIGRDNYGLFSLTTVRDTDAPPTSAGASHKRAIGIGILGGVYLWRGV